jgi:raffinose/stachyose/melibiose transport system permease protein
MIVHKRLGGLFSSAVLTFWAFIALFPLALAALNSFKTHKAVVQSPIAFPSKLDLHNYIEAWKVGEFGEGLMNSVFMVGTTIVVVVSFASLAAFVLAGKRLKIWPLVMVYFMVAMTVPIQLFLFPLYFIYARLHLIGSVPAVGVILAALNMPFSVFLLRTYFMQVPKELEDSARIDGATVGQLFWYIFLPIISPGLITVSIIVGLIAWNEFLITSTFLQGAENFTVTLKYLSMNGTYTSDIGLLLAGAMILIVPVGIFFLLMQRYFIEGFVSSALKG